MAGSDERNTARGGGWRMTELSPSDDSMCNFFKWRKYPEQANMLLKKIPDDPRRTCCLSGVFIADIEFRRPEETETNLLGNLHTFGGV